MLGAAPAIYQPLLDKDADLRVTVVGGEVFACRIDSQRHEDGRVDWRRAGSALVSVEVFDLDDAIAQRCRALTRKLRLEVAGIDLVLTQGEIIFLEINAAGQWAWIEEATRLPIAAAIANRLVSGACTHRRGGGQPKVGRSAVGTVAV